MKRLFTAFVAGAALCLGLATDANASNIQVDYTGQIGAGNVRFNLNGDGQGTRSTSAGLFTFHEDSNTSGIDILGANSIYAFCIQLEQTVGGNNVGYTIGDLADGRTPNKDNRGTLGADRAKRIDMLFNLAFAGTGGIINPAAGSTVLQAVQIAIWEIAYEAGNATLGLGNGTISFASSANSNAALNYITNQNWLSTINSTTLSTYQPSLFLWSMNNEWKQDFVVQSDAGGATEEVPEPGTMALSGLALVGLALLGRRKARA
ncbi:MAG: PEP-CTERM sorting domain-containing protein [Bryobacterales bacterium]|nr:PEP-CTERM sorting domain-containing protein [Bryobacterales bacterium]